MRIMCVSLAIGFVFVTMGVRPTEAQSVVNQLQPLVETSARRLAIARQVALSKWDSGAAVEDVPRETQVISNAIKAAEAKGLDSASAERFFKAQIEANKIVQYSLLADWRRAGNAPSHPLVDLKGAIRPELDRLQAELVAELLETKTIRAASSCRVDIATAAGKYRSTHPQETSKLIEIALDVALSESCTN
jgi:chorismate mutase